MDSLERLLTNDKFWGGVITVIIILAFFGSPIVFKITRRSRKNRDDDED